MDILKILIDKLADVSILAHEVSETQAPRAPVASDLTDDELTFTFGLSNGLVNLLNGIDILIIYLFQCSLGT